MHFAARSGSENTVAILLNNGANVNALDKVSRVGRILPLVHCKIMLVIC